jgi:hypothetical protein
MAHEIHEGQVEMTLFEGLNHIKIEIKFHKTTPRKSVLVPRNGARVKAQNGPLLHNQSIEEFNYSKFGKKKPV